MISPDIILKDVFGFTDFRPGQLEIINSILNGKNIIAILPTGAGKSICYQIPAIAADNFSIVISPLIALMKDQVDSLNKSKKISAFINSTLDFKQSEKVFREIGNGEIKILYVSPERLEILNFAERIKNLGPKFLFVDEAHCISEWGHSFRPSYKKIKEFAEFINVKSISAFTATAAPEVRDDIILQLNLINPEIFIRGYERENLNLNVIVAKDKKAKTLELIKNYPGSAIIYCSTRKNAEDISSFLNINGIHSQYYHAGLSAELRRIVQDDFINDRVTVIAATNAFGMGIDKKDIRLIIHFNMPGSIENYYQEIGRAGRDGLESNTFLLYSNSDKETQRVLIEKSYPDKEQIKYIYNAICDYGKTALNSVPAGDIPLDENFIKLINRNGISKGVLESAINLLDEAGYLKRPRELSYSHRVLFLLPVDKMQYFIGKMTSPTNKEILFLLLRRYGSILFQHKTSIDSGWLADLTGLTSEEIISALTLLSNSGIIDYDPPAASPSIKLLIPRVDTKYLRINYDRVDKLLEHDLKKLERIVEFVYSNSCRFEYILKYFGENIERFTCSRCDNCLGKNPIQSELLEYLEEAVLTTVSQINSISTRNDLIAILTGKTENAELRKIGNFGICNLYSTIEIDSAIDTAISKKYLNEFNNIITITGKGNSIIENLITRCRNSESGRTYDDRLELFNKLRQVRKEAAVKFSQPSNMICPDEVLSRIAEYRPVKASELLAVENFTRRMFNKIGREIMDTVKEHVSSAGPMNKIKGKNLPENISATLNLIKKGYSLKDISELTKLPESVVSIQIETILGMLPEINIDSLIDKNEAELINKKIDEGFFDIKEIKQSLPPFVSYAAIRIILAKRRPT